MSSKSVIRGSFIGVLLGAIPGIGVAPAAFLSYSEARRTSKEPEKFGKGSLEGVAASEAGNNGVAGATMIALLALGIPGDVITAVILGTLIIHGLRPGPILFDQILPMISGDDLHGYGGVCHAATGYSGCTFSYCVCIGALRCAIC